MPWLVVEVLRPEFFVDDAPLLDAEAGAIVAELVIAAFSAAAFSAAALRSGFGALAGRSGIGSGIGSGSATLALATTLVFGLEPSAAAAFWGGVFEGALFAGVGFAIAGTSAVTAFGFALGTCFGVDPASIGTSLLAGLPTGADFTAAPADGAAARVPTAPFWGADFAGAGFVATTAPDFVGFGSGREEAFNGAAFWVFATASLL